MNHYDLIIIGAGPGGYETAIAASALGLHVKLIERDSLGGTCLNRGCIPTKALARCARAVTDIGRSGEFGIDVPAFTPSFQRAIERKDRIVSSLRDGIPQLLAGVDVVKGEATFKDTTTITVDDTEYTAPHIIVATGSSPASLPITGAEYAVSSDFILSMTSLPDSIAIIGGGVIGMEFASILNAYGVEVTVIEYCKEILPTFDRDISKRLRQLLSRQGIRFVTSAAATSIAPDGAVSYEAKGKPGRVTAGMVLMAVGRKPVIPAGIDRLGVEITRRGITVDDNMYTGIGGIHAIGDVNGRCQLAHAATAQGRRALAHILDKRDGTRLDIVPSAVYTTPECAMVGMTGEQCDDQGIPHSDIKVTLRGNGRAMTLGETDGLVKLICSNPSESESQRILGCHVMAPEADLLVQEVAVAMAAGLSPAQLADTIHAHPTIAEAIRDAAAMAGRLQ